MKPKLRLPSAIAVAVLGGATAAAVVTASCGDDGNETCDVYCVPDGLGGGANCPAPDYPCATGPNLDECPSGCIPEPVA